MRRLFYVVRARAPQFRQRRGYSADFKKRIHQRHSLDFLSVLEILGVKNLAVTLESCGKDERAVESVRLKRDPGPWLVFSVGLSNVQTNMLGSRKNLSRIHFIPVETASGLYIGEPFH